MKLTSVPQSVNSASQAASPAARRDWLWGILIVLATFLAYQPAWNGQLIWDDAAHMTYAHLRSLHGLLRLWTEPGVTQQYYPMVSTVFWLEHRLWGDSTLGYHLVNILLHSISALLLLRILRRLEVPAAGMAAAVFALHPVQVESVAWISELKNTLSGVCYFAAALAYLRFDRTRNKGLYVAALVLFAVGLMAKTVIATLPAALLVVFWWKRGRLTWKQDVLPLVPFLGAGMAAGCFTSWVETELVGAQGSTYNLTLVERCIVAGRALWFYLGKLAWPADLIFSYSRWKISGTDGLQWLFPISAAIVVVVLWSVRRRWRGPLAAALFFIGTLFPALGFVNVFPFKYSFVADHFQYLAAIGPIVAATVGIHAVLGWLKEQRVVWERSLCAVILAVFCVLTWRQSRMYQDIETLWLTTIARNPDCWLAQNDLGEILYKQGRVDEAISRFRAAVEIQPDDAEAQNNLGAALDKKGQIDEAMACFQRALAIRPEFSEAHCNLGNCLLRKGQLDDAIAEFQKAVDSRPDFPDLHIILGDALLQKGMADAAAVQFGKLLELEPNNVQGHYNLGVALRQMGQIGGAIEEFQKAVAIQPGFGEAQNNLGNCLLQQGRADEAISHLQKALEALPDYAPALYNLGNALLQKGNVDQAIVEFQKLLALQPKSPQARRSLAGIAWRLATSPDASQRNGARAVELARQTDQLAGDADPMMPDILAAAYAEAGDFNQAISIARRALELANRQGNSSLANAIQARLVGYQAGSPFRDAGKSP